MTGARRLSVVSEAPSPGERRALWREEHLCLRCIHHMVCKVVAAISPPDLVTIAACAAFEPAQPGRGEPS